MNNKEFRQFNVYFHYTDYDPNLQTWPEHLERVRGRSLIRGCLMFNDLDFADDPWDYTIEKNRVGKTSSSGGTKPKGSGE